jgi:environmental stress-induced protein Ves
VIREDIAYAVELVRRDQQHTSTWNGGTTTEIAIYPKNAVYRRRGFVWRISSACVESEESEFTALPGIWRLIMVLEGDMTLEHEHHHSVRLAPFQQDAFAGDWMTRSRGRARDFNIMLSGACTGQMQAVSVQEQSSLAIPVETVQTCGKGKKAVLVVYGVDGTIVASVGVDGTWRVNTGDALLLTTDHQGATRSVRLSNEGDVEAHVVLATIWYEEVPRQELRA